MKKIAIIGGTGKEGKGLAYRWAKHGHSVVIGSRSVEKAQIAADEINALVTGDGKDKVVGLENSQAADWCDYVVMTVPYEAHADMLCNLNEIIKGKILIDVTVPLVPPKVHMVHVPKGGSAGLEAQAILGDETPVVMAFQNISYERLFKEDDIDCDVLVCGTSKQAREAVLELVREGGMTGWDAGPLANSIVIEGLTSVLIYINKNYGSREAGIKITGVIR